MGGRFLARVARGRMLLRNMVLAWRRDDGLLKTVKSFSCAGEGGGRAAPCTCSTPRPKPKTALVSCGLGGAVSDCGDAVNPSMGAWPRHPCRGHPALPTHPAADRFRVFLTHGSEKKIKSKGSLAGGLL